MNLNDLLREQNIKPESVLVLRHKPQENQLKKVLPWLAAERPEVFNAYQQTQGKKLEKVMQSLAGVGYIASFIGTEAGKALFVGLYSIGEAKPLAYMAYLNIPAVITLKEHGYNDLPEDRQASILWFDLTLTDILAPWKGKLIVDWPPPDLSWWRWAHRNEMPIHAILEDSMLSILPKWDKIDFSWNELSILPMKLRDILSQWRGIYYIFDTSDQKGYVGSAYGEENLLGRWKNYSVSGHGGDVLLRQRDPQYFRFTILELVAPVMKPKEVIELETSWKLRLHTHNPNGLNDN